MKSAKFTLIGTVALVAAGCAGREATPERTLVTVSLPPQEWFVKAIAGDSVDVNVLLTSGANPESFEPGISAIKDASRSSVIFISGGLPFETSLAGKIGGRRVVDTSEGIEKLYGTHDHCAHGHAAHRHGEADPHTWTSVKNGKTIARNIFDALVEADPQREDYYTARYVALVQRIDSLDRALAEQLDGSGRKSFLVMHPSLSYFARDYGLEQVSIGREGQESSVPGLRRQLDRATGEGAEVMFVQEGFDSRQAESVASQASAKVVVINLLSPDWEGELIRIADALATD